MATENQQNEQGTLIAVPTAGGGGKDDVEQSLAGILRSQYTSREFNDIFSATELREHECIIISDMFSSRFVSLVMATADDITIDPASPEAKNIRARLNIKKTILSDPNAMMFVIYDSWLYAFGLTRISLKRQSRVEGMHISSASLLRQLGVDGSQIGLGQKLASKFGVGSHRIAYIPKKYDEKAP